jgi:IS4 transposase
MGFLEIGTLSYLYKIRWNIEKVFDEIKNKLAEKKSMGDL